MAAATARPPAPVAAAAPRADAAAAAASPRAGPSSSSAARPVRFSPHLHWDGRKKEVLQEFTLTGKISVAASFLMDEDDKEEQESLPLEKARQKLEQLEAQARGGGVEMSQAEYERRIGKLQRDLTRAWNANQRVTSLKIAIQCSKLLTEPRVPQFYPSIFVMVTEILDTFGRLVFERLKAVADAEHMKMGGTKPLPDDFVLSDVGAEARETTRNWVYKVACIRELLPRLYVEMALLECYRFMYGQVDYSSILMRLSHSIRGIGNPLVAVYARWYLARMAAKLLRDEAKLRETVLSSFQDYMFTFKEISTGARTAQLEALGISMPVYLNLHSPAVAWLVHAAGWGAGKDTFQLVMQQYREWCGNSMVLKHIIDGFAAEHHAPYIAGMLTLVKEAGTTAAAASLVTPADLYTSLARAYAKVPPPPAHRISFLNEAWKAITKVGEPVAYARSAVALVELLLVAYTEREVLLLLGDLVRRMQAAAAAGGGAADAGGASRAAGGHVIAPPAALPHLEKLLTLLVEDEVRRMAAAAEAAEAAAAASGGEAPLLRSGFSSILTSEYFGKLLDMFSSDQKPSLCQSLLSSLVGVPGAITDPVVVNTMFEVARTVHDALDVLSPEDEIQAANSLICAFVDKIDFGRDLERQLQVYTDCRQSFPDLDAVKARVIRKTGDLAMKALKLMKGKHNNKTLQFVKAAFASAAVAIPTLDDPFARLQLSTRTATAALHNSCVSQADALLRSVVADIPELPASLLVSQALSSATVIPALGTPDERLVEFLRQEYVPAAIPMPGHPEHGPFYLVRGLLNAIQRYPWSSGAESIERCQAVLLVLSLLHSLSKDPLPVRIPGLDSNDVLYAGDASYRTELVTLQRTVLETMINGLQEAGTAAAAGNTGAKAVLLQVIPEMLQADTINACLDLDKAVVPAFEQACLALKSVAPEHTALKAAIALIGARVRGGQ